MRLLLAELLRFWTRRMVLVAVPLMIVLAAAAAVPAAMTSLPVSAAEQAQAQSAYAEEYEQWQQECSDPTADESCDLWKPEPQVYLRVASPVPEAWSLAISLKTGLVALMCLLVGVSFVAAEFRSEAIGTWLTFNPNRYAVYATKAGAAALSLAIANGAVVLAQAAAFAIVLASGGVSFSVAGLPALIGWNLVGGFEFTIVAVAIGMLFRHTVAGLAIAIGVNFVEGIASVVLMFLGSGWGRLAQYLPGTQLGAVLSGGSEFILPDMESGGTISQTPITAEAAALYWAILGVILTAGAVLSFVRREVR